MRKDFFNSDHVRMLPGYLEKKINACSRKLQKPKLHDQPGHHLPSPTLPLPSVDVRFSAHLGPDTTILHVSIRNQPTKQIITGGRKYLLLIKGPLVQSRGVLRSHNVKPGPPHLRARDLVSRAGINENGGHRWLRTILDFLSLPSGARHSLQLLVVGLFVYLHFASCRSGRRRGV